MDRVDGNFRRGRCSVRCEPELSAEPANFLCLRPATRCDSGSNRRSNTAEAYPSASNDLRHLLSMSASFYGDQSSKTVGWTIMLAPTEFREHLEKNVPQSNFETTRDWIVALKKEIDHVLIPRVRGRRPDPQGYAIAAAELLASETKMEELATEERLDASIDRALKRLFWLKTQKQLDRAAEQKIVNGQSSRISDK